MTKILFDGRDVANLEWSLAGESGFFDGARVMTTFMVLGSWLVDFDRHMARLKDHASSVGLDASAVGEVIKFEVEALIESLRTPPKCRARIILFKDSAGQMRRVVTVSALSDASLSLPPDGIKLMPVMDKSWPRGAQIKTGWVGPVRGQQIARAKADGFDDALWINGDGEIAEATWANIFLIGRTGDLVEIATPPEASGILAGVTRRRMIDLLTSASIPVTERVITEEEIPRFDEAFVSSSIRGIAPVAAIGRHRLHTNRAQAVFHHIARLYKTWMSVGISGGQAQVGKDLLT